MGLSIVKGLRTAIVTLLLAMLHLSQLQAQDRGKGNPSGTRHLAFSPDGRLLAATYGGIDQPGTLRIWDLQTGAMVCEHQEPDGVCSVSFSPDSDSVAIGMFGKVGKVLDVTTGNVQFELRGHQSHVRSITYVDERVIATGSYDKTIRLWNAQTGVQISQLGQPTDELRTIAVSPNGQYLLSGSASPNCRLWDLAEMKEVALFHSPNFICPNVCFSRDGEFFLTGRWDGIVRIREVASQRLRAAVMVSALRALDMSPDNSLLLGCSDKPVLQAVDLRLDGPTAEESAKVMQLVRLWNSDDYQVREKASRELLEMGMVAARILERLREVNAPEIRIRARTAHRTIMESASRDVDVGHDFNLSAVCFSPDNLHVASGDVGGNVKVWRYRDEMVIHHFTGFTSIQLEENSR